MNLKEPTGQIAVITKAIAREYGVHAEQLKGPSRMRRICRPRFAAIWCCRKLTNHSLQVIGHYFGDRDHTSIIHAVTQVDQQFTEHERAYLLGVAEAALYSVYPPTANILSTPEPHTVTASEWAESTPSRRTRPGWDSLA